MTTVLPSRDSYCFGIISDTHGYLPEEALAVFRDVDMILHAGDIGSAAIVTALEAIAPVTAVRGNMDSDAWSEGFRYQETVHAGDQRMLLIHDAGRLQPDRLQDGFLAVISGHTHRPSIENRQGILLVNPGSAGAPRYGEPASVALLQVSKAHAAADIIRLRR